MTISPTFSPLSLHEAVNRFNCSDLTLPLEKVGLAGSGRIDIGYAVTGRLQTAGVRILMDGRGLCMDNIFIEWPSLQDWFQKTRLNEMSPKRPQLMSE